MGVISEMVKSDAKDTLSAPRPVYGRPSQDARAVWQEVFGVNKEDPKPHSRPPVPGGAWGRGVTSTGYAQMRLLQAFRSMAPGGWADNYYEMTRRQTGVNYVAVTRICMAMSQCTFTVYEKDERHPQGKRSVYKGHPGYDLVELLEKPNNQDSFGQLVYRIMQQKMLTGTSLIWMPRNVLDRPMELYPVPTAIAIPQPAVNPDFPDGFYRIQPIYPYGPFSSYPTPASAVGAAISANEMIRIQSPHPLLRYEGYGPLSGLRLNMDELEMIDRSRHYSMRREINPSAVLQFENFDGIEPLPEEEIDRIRTDFENDFYGPENSGRLLVATPGSKLEPWGGRPLDMDYPTGWDQLTSFILGGGFGITKPAAGMLEDASYSTLYATLKQLHLVTLDPESDILSAAFTKHLAPFFGENLIVEVKCKRIDDPDVLRANLGMLMDARAISKNEVRQALEYPLTREPWGNEIAGMEPLPPGGVPGPLGALQEAMVGPMPSGVPGLQGELEQGGPVAPELDEINQEPRIQDRWEPEAPEIAATRPLPGKLGAGALGPRKSLKAQTKSFYDQVRDACHSNGNGNGKN